MPVDSPSTPASRSTAWVISRARSIGCAMISLNCARVISTSRSPEGVEMVIVAEEVSESISLACRMFSSIAFITDTGAERRESASSGSSCSTCSMSHR